MTFLGRDWAAGALADPDAWFHDPITGRRWAGSERSAFEVDVRSTGAGIGDVKYVWEANRLQILHPLAASIARGNSAGDRGVGLGRGRPANPPYRGVNWVSGIELALRLMSLALFVAALDPNTFSPEDRGLVRRLVAAHANHLAAFRSKFSSANNHLVAEGLGLLVAGWLAPDLPGAAAWEAEGRRILETEALAQILRRRRRGGAVADLSGLHDGDARPRRPPRGRGRAALERRPSSERLAAGAEHLLWIARRDRPRARHRRRRRRPRHLVSRRTASRATSPP